MIFKKRKGFKEDIERWFNDRGDHIHLRNYSIDRNDTVVDIGAYRGQWLLDMYSKYGCNCVGFEPVKKFTEDIQFPDKIKIYPFALGTSDTEHSISIDNDESSIDTIGNYKILIKDAKRYINMDIRLLMINIEGYEYDLVPYLIENKCLDGVKNIQIQFHSVEGVSKNKMKSIIKSLEKEGFKTKFHYEFIWWGGSKEL